MNHENSIFRARYWVLAVAFLLCGFAESALAQRSVPVFVENDRGQPIPVEFVQPGAHGSGAVQYILCLQGISGPGVGKDYPGCSEISALGLKVGREMKESGEKGGTADINIGIGELSPVEIRKPTDGLSATLFSYGLNGNSFGSADIYVLEQRESWTNPLTTLEVHLDRTFVQSLELDSNSLSEIVLFYFNEIEVKSYTRGKTGSVLASSERCWDKTKSIPCSK